jgi:hypothetical protein
MKMKCNRKIWGNPSLSDNKFTLAIETGLSYRWKQFYPTDINGFTLAIETGVLTFSFFSDNIHREFKFINYVRCER